MKITTLMKSRRAEQRQELAFTLIEMIGVLAIIAILASLLIPKVFSAIDRSRVNNTVMSYNTIKTAVTDHYGKYGSLLVSNSISMVAPDGTDFGAVLLAESLIDKPLTVKVGTGAAVILWTNWQNSGGGATMTPAGYLLDGVNQSVSNMTSICEIIVSNVAPQDALDVGTILDGPTLTTNAPDAIGRVKFDGVNLYMYVTGR
jgi:prepilin-type N-terminal cleavage/methylation domain-containing protein